MQPLLRQAQTEEPVVSQNKYLKNKYQKYQINI